MANSKQSLHIDLTLYWGEPQENWFPRMHPHIHMWAYAEGRLDWYGTSMDEEKEFLLGRHMHEQRGNDREEWSFELRKGWNRGRCIAEGLKARTAEMFSTMTIPNCTLEDVLKPLHVGMMITRPRGNTPLWEMLWVHRRDIVYHNDEIVDVTSASAARAA